MQRSADDDQLLQGGRGTEEEAKTVGQIAIAMIGLVAACFTLFALIAAALLYVGVVFGIKRKWILYTLLPVAVFGLLIIHGTHEWMALLGFMSWMQIPYITPLAEEYLNRSQPFPINAYSYVGTLSLGILMANVVHPFIEYYRSKIVKSKHDGLRKQKKERDYKQFRLNREKYLNKKQLQFRKSKSTENFIGYDEFQQRVSLEPHEANQHIFAVATTGGGKTVLIGTNVENALRQNKPIIFMDGKGELKSMLQFKEMCEKHGRTVHMFTDIDELSFNFLRHGTPTQLRDKVMNLFEWSEPFYKTNCSRFLQLVFRMLRDFNQPIELETVYEFTAKSKVARFLADQTEHAKVKIEVPKRKFVLDQEPEEPRELIEEELTEPVGEKTTKEAELPEEPEPNPESEPAELTNEDLAKLLGDIPSAEPKDSAAALFGLQDETEPFDASMAVEAEPNQLPEESEPLEDVQNIPDEPPTSTDPEENAEPLRASTLFEGLEEDAEEPDEPEVQYQVEWDEEMRAKIQYYRERFFGLEEEEDEPSGISFGALTSLRNQLAELIESDLGHLFVEREDGIDLKAITDNNEVAIFSISGNKYKDYIKTLGRVVIMEVNTLVDYRQKEGKKSIMSVYDEFSAYVSHEVVDVINKSRSAGFECLLSVQGLSDIDAVDPVLTRQIINNCNTYMIGRVNDPADAEVLAAACGTYEDADITSQVEKNAWKKRFESEMGTVRMVQRYRAHPDDIRGLGTGEVFLCRKTIDQDGAPYVARVYVRNALDLTGIGA
ncbi:TraM recognition domain-containing protein [Paenibacillus sp. OK076]|uniref:TraM recognition domain-containing protein n=1 Tax=Paenibacillus sp. OK076 TaxID=1884379 RepID=UPI0008AD9F2D|nr:TraM recognition domain-containing protein [Paenibacillus sp. OK076]SEP33403.1 Type IV secretory system Conjugative DNA transfer [Paenibacillus sp. OK076]